SGKALHARSDENVETRHRPRQHWHCKPTVHIRRELQGHRNHGRNAQPSDGLSSRRLEEKLLQPNRQDTRQTCELYFHSREFPSEQSLSTPIPGSTKLGSQLLRS